VARLETQVARFQTTAETAERAEEELKAEKRKLQREVNGVAPQCRKSNMSRDKMSKILKLSFFISTLNASY
jgi:ribosomal protein L44E